MTRSLVLAIAAVTLAQVLPSGCPFNVASNNNTADLPTRGLIPTSATAEPGPVAAGTSVALLAAADSSSGAVSFNWVQVSGPGAKIQGAGSATASFTAPSLKSQQTLRFMVTTSDSAGDVGSAAVEVVVAADPKIAVDVPPVAKAGGDQVVIGGAIVTLNGVSSIGQNLTFNWTQTSGSPQVSLGGAQSAVATFTAPTFVAGSSNLSVFELTVTDAKQRTSRDSMNVIVRDPNDQTKTRVRIKTNASGGAGDIVVELEDAKSPITVANFLSYVDEGHFDGTIFHRVIKDFVIQGGEFLPDLTRVPEHDPIVLESNNGLHNVRGSIAMARTSDPNSASAQFFINVVDNSSSLDRKDDNNPGYAVFGTVITGMDVVDAISQVRTVTKGFPPDVLEDCPFDDVIMNQVRREP